MSLVTVIDASENGKYLVIAIFSVEESRVNMVFQEVRGWIKHSKKLGKRKAKYYQAFQQRFPRIKELAHYSNAFRVKKTSRAKEFPRSFWNALDMLVNSSSLIIVDDKLVQVISRRYPSSTIIAEGKVNKSKKQLLIIALLADNIANYVRLYGDYDLIRKG